LLVLEHQLCHIKQLLVLEHQLYVILNSC